MEAQANGRGKVVERLRLGVERRVKGGGKAGERRWKGGGKAEENRPGKEHTAPCTFAVSEQCCTARTVRQPGAPS